MLALQFFVLLALGAETALSDYVTDVGYVYNLTCTSRYGAIQRARILTATSKTTRAVSVTMSIRHKINVIVTRTTRTRTTTTTTKTTTTTTSTGADITDTTYTPETRTITKTIELTSSEYETITETNTVLETTVVPAPDGFVAIKNDPAIVQKLAPKPKKEPANRVKLQILKSNKIAVDPIQYMQRIECTHTIRKITTTTIETTIKGRTIYPAPPTTTVTATVTSTSTSTEYAPGVVVSTVTLADITEVETTLYPVTTTTYTQTDMTEVTSTVTEYAACRETNALSFANGGETIYALNSYYSYAYTDAKTQTDCCIFCMRRPDCLGSWYWNLGGNKGCGFLYKGGDACPAQEAIAGFYYSDGRRKGVGYTMSNGPCGKWRNGGSG